MPRCAICDEPWLCEASNTCEGHAVPTRDLPSVEDTIHKLAHDDSALKGPAGKRAGNVGAGVENRESPGQDLLNATEATMYSKSEVLRVAEEVGRLYDGDCIVAKQMLLTMRDALDAKDARIVQLDAAAAIARDDCRDREREIERLRAIEKFAEGLPTLGEIERMRSTIAFLESDIERLRSQRDEVLRLCDERDTPFSSAVAVSDVRRILEAE